MTTPDHGEVRRFYDNEYYGQHGNEGGLPWHVRSVASRLGDLRGKAVLDIACGTGQWIEELARRGAKVSGIDISSRAVELAHARLPQADIREGVAEELPFEDGSFDLVTCMGSLEHFLDQPRALAEMKRVATKDARFLILVPNAGFLTRRLGLYGGTGQVAIRETVRPLAEWAALIEAAGLKIETRWRDLHTLGVDWIRRGSPWAWPLRAGQAVALSLWPIAWQYQVYFYCRLR
jgi:SAM-dependent methyltransferase